MKKNLNNKFLIKDFKEDEITDILSSYQSSRNNLIKGIGDDCAVVNNENNDEYSVYTSDATIEGVHFNFGESPERIGNKAIGRVLSDFAAMGARPRWVLINLSIPQNYKMDDLKNIYSSIQNKLDQYECSIVGGDLNKSKILGFNIFGAGIARYQNIIYRDNVNINQKIWCTGQLGLSTYGKHLDFPSRVEEGLWLSEFCHAKSMIDITDGLVIDLNRLLNNKFGAILYADALEKMSNIENVLYNGEDYELLFTSSSLPDVLLNSWKQKFSCELTCIGHVIEKSNIYLKSDRGINLLEVKGYEHF